MKEIRRLSRNVHESLRSSTFLFDLPRVVDELVYNSLDAGSTKVVVSLSVGSCYVKVEDDGCGVTRDGLIILGERYTSSKVHLLTDTSSATETLGFRGEALSSISDISLVEIRSKARGKPNAYCKIIKSSKCLFFGIDDQREDVGTTVIVRDLFYNQPIRRKFMQSSLRKVMHYVKKCVLRIALVHPQVSFKVIDIEGEHKLLCTIPASSPLPLVTDGFGNEVSSLLREIICSGPALTLSGYISGPTDAFSAKVLQYIYINSRFVCKGPIHNLINSLATSFQSTIANWRDNSTNHGPKRQKTQGYPAYLLNLCCHMSSYDLSFEPSKTRVEFKDWGAVLLFFEESIMPYWKQFTSNPFQGGSAASEASFHENGRDDMLTEGISRSYNLKVMKDITPVHQDSNSSRRNINHVDIFFDDANNYQEPNLLIDDQEDFCSLPMRCHSKDSDVEVVKSFSHHEVNSLQGSSKNRKQSRYMSRKRREPHGMVYDHYNFPLACDSAPCKTYSPLKNERVNSASCSTSCVFHKDHDFLMEPSDEVEGTAGANWYNECLHVRDNVIFKWNMGNTLLQEKMNLQQPVIGVIRKCQKSTRQDTPLGCKVSPFFDDWAFLTEETNLGHGIVADVDSDSRLEYSFHNDYKNPFIARTTPRIQDIMHDSTLIENHVYALGTSYQHYAIEEKNAEFLDFVSNESGVVLPALNCTSNSMSDCRFSSSPKENLQYDSPLDQFAPNNDGSTFLLNEERGSLLSESSSIQCEEGYNTSFLNFAKQIHGHAVESSSNNKEFQKSLTSEVRESRLWRSHSAPPFYNGKKKFPTLNCLPTDYSKEKFTMKSYHALDETEPFSASQPCTEPITKFSQPCSRELKYGKLNQNNMIEIQTCEGFDNGSATDELDLASASLSKWRTGILQPAFNNDGVRPHEVDVLDISSGLLHLSGNSMVPTSINKGCFENAKVLQQLDRKFIPVVAGGTLVIIDQHAADERIRLEELRKKVLRGDLCSSTYLNPVHELILPEMGYQLLHKYEEQIKKWGWIYNSHSQHSESFSMSMNFLRPHKCRATLVAVPRILGTDLMGKDLLEYIEQLVETDGSSMIPPAVIRILNYKACRGAIMFGDALLPSECSLIVEELKATSLCFQCAHGRPTTVPLVNMAALQEQLARLGKMAGQPEEWHGLRRHTPSFHRARQRLELCENLVPG
ncbi:DNA mismatch repair protein MLH3 [Platanthera zijinensis]|uniref:DNA mismatch repair protein MLH3 n=1 Tax=Platanthera zijinensis TaxID=2320716 RepID=A0AAP0G4Z4_9ASPA